MERMTIQLLDNRDAGAEMEGDLSEGAAAEACVGGWTG
jgi:hypothetical protein